MKKIAITQRVEHISGINERRDCLDQRWFDFARLLGVHLIPIPNNLQDVNTFITDLGLEGFVFSGGNNIDCEGGNSKSLEVDGVAYERDKTEGKVLEWAIQNKAPVVGICRGMQYINVFFGGGLSLVDEDTHVAKEHDISFSDPLMRTWYTQLGKVNSYHKFGITSSALGKELDVCAQYGDEIEAFRHHEYPIWGIMWHPERINPLPEADIQLFKYIFNL